MSEEDWANYYDPSEEAAKPPAATDALARLAVLAEQQEEAETQVEEIEEALRVAKYRLRDIAEVQIPEAMDEAGVEEFTTSSGLKISVAEKILGSLSEERSEAAFAWLAEHGYSELIKREFKIVFNKDEEQWAEAFAQELTEREHPLRHEIKRAIHPSTLQAWVKEQLREGVDIPLDTFGVYRSRKSKIERKKK